MRKTGSVACWQKLSTHILGRPKFGTSNNRGRAYAWSGVIKFGILRIFGGKKASYPRMIRGPYIYPSYIENRFHIGAADRPRPFVDKFGVLQHHACSKAGLLGRSSFRSTASGSTQTATLSTHRGRYAGYLVMVFRHLDRRSTNNLG